MTSLPALRNLAKQNIFRFLPRRLQEEIDFHFYLRRLRSGTQVPEKEFEILHHFVERGTVALDVGANLGGYAIALADLVGPGGEVHAFEPVPRTSRLLERSASRLGKKIRVHKVAVSDSVGEATFYVPLSGTLENFYVASLLQPSDKTLELRTPTTTLDAWRRSHDQARVSFVKIDVEGVEYDTLSGSLGLLDADHPVVLCEISGGPEATSRRDVFRLMSEHGYASFQYLEDGLLHSSSLEDQKGPNFIFIPVVKLARYQGLMA